MSNRIAALIVLLVGAFFVFMSVGSNDELYIGLNFETVLAAIGVGLIAAGAKTVFSPKKTKQEVV